MKITIAGRLFPGGDFVKWARQCGLKGTKVELLTRLEIATKLGTFAGITVEQG